MRGLVRILATEWRLAKVLAEELRDHRARRQREAEQRRRQQVARVAQELRGKYGAL